MARYDRPNESRLKDMIIQLKRATEKLTAIISESFDTVCSVKSEYGESLKKNIRLKLDVTPLENLHSIDPSFDLDPL